MISNLCNLRLVLMNILGLFTILTCYKINGVFVVLFHGPAAFRGPQFNKQRSDVYVHCVGSPGERAHSSTLRH
jgi:hypothetical protein